MKKNLIPSTTQKKQSPPLLNGKGHNKLVPLKQFSIKPAVIQEAKELPHCNHKKAGCCKKCKKPTAIHSLPFTISKSGKYCLSKDLLYSGDSIAIVIQATTVELDLNNHNLLINNPNAIGISVNDSSNVSIKNGTIVLLTEQTDESIGVGVSISDSNKVALENLFISNFSFGIVIVSSTEISLLKVRSQNALQSNLSTTEVRGLNLKNVFFINDATVIGTAGVALRRTNEVNVYNSNFINSDIFYVGGSVANFDKIRVEITDVNYPFGALQLGTATVSTDSVIAVTDVIIQNSVLVNRSNQGSVTGDSLAPAVIFLSTGKNFLIQDCVLSMDPQLPYAEALPLNAVIAIGSSNEPRLINLIGSGENPPTNVSNIVIQDCLINGPSVYNVVIGSDPENEVQVSKVTLKENNISDASQYNIFLLNVNRVVIKENAINNSDANAGGILVDGDSTKNIIRNNDIIVDGQYGISLTASTSGNIVKENVIISQLGISNLGANLLIDNTVSNQQ